MRLWLAQSLAATTALALSCDLDCQNGECVRERFKMSRKPFKTSLFAHGEINFCPFSISGFENHVKNVYEHPLKTRLVLPCALRM